MMYCYLRRSTYDAHVRMVEYVRRGWVDTSLCHHAFITSTIRDTTGREVAFEVPRTSSIEQHFHLLCWKITNLNHRLSNQGNDMIWQNWMGKTSFRERFFNLLRFKCRHASQAHKLMNVERVLRRNHIELGHTLNDPTYYWLLRSAATPLTLKIGVLNARGGSTLEQWIILSKLFECQSPMDGTKTHGVNDFQAGRCIDATPIIIAIVMSCCKLQWYQGNHKS